MSNKATKDCGEITPEDVKGFAKAFYARKPLPDKAQAAMNRSRVRADKIFAERSA